MNGSEKQIAWANEIKAKAEALIAGYRKASDEMPEISEHVEFALGQLEKFVAHAGDDAKTWIDNRQAVDSANQSMHRYLSAKVGAALASDAMRIAQNS